MPEDYPDFPHHTQIKDYLDSYAEAFGLRTASSSRTAWSSAERLPTAAAGQH